jgi:Flp pilus assembly pilin Flp
MRLRAVTTYVHQLLADEAGATLVEYVVVASIICGAIVLVATSLGAQISQMFSNAGQNF